MKRVGDYVPQTSASPAIDVYDLETSLSVVDLLLRPGAGFSSYVARAA